jgi:outer membrane protein assembly factor BamD
VAEAYALLTERGQRPDVAPEGKRESWLQRLIPGAA